ncbi:MAG TPA: CPBP family intramembrane glutamic endopeptidase [Dongiaceae bacterium]|nr:CPBP family intramembrane glutamic endopeptidase [Dongiaceae bacterium]
MPGGGNRAVTLSLPGRPAGLIAAAIGWSLITAGLTYLLAQPLLPPVPKITDATEASNAVVATVLIPSVIHSLIASILFLAAALAMAWLSGRSLLLAAAQQRHAAPAQPRHPALMQTRHPAPASNAANPRRSAIRIGLGDRALGAPIQLAGVVLLVLAYAGLLSYLQFRNSDDFFGAVFRAGAGWRLVAFIALGLLAPVAEEMLFRGWLWTGLRRSWPGFACTLVTGLIWILTHFVEGPVKMAILAPVALLLGFARQSSASWRAPLVLHLALNIGSLAAPFLLRWANLG